MSYKGAHLHIIIVVMAGLVLVGFRAVPGEKEMSTIADLHKHTNKLISETSPYLLQHAHNPVDWHPWSEEAFEIAREQDKPVFLSIGYSTCHWCHVMERESFSNVDIAAILNKNFVNTKVDREERPDVDAVYMNAVQAMTGSGGWPLSVFLTPEGEPFYGGTYFPPTETYGLPSFKQVLLSIADAWEDKREQLVESAGKTSKILAGLSEQGGQRELSLNILEKAKSDLQNIFDDTHGGFGIAPKFPQPSNLSILLRYWHRTGDKTALAMVERALDAMADGGICDHLGGGFHRYSTDVRWLVPHFEKMLYDQALISKVYIKAYQVSKDERYAAIAKHVLDYVLRDMTDSKGGYYSAEDADSEGKEGTFYVWEAGEIEEVLGAEDAKIFNEYYGVSKGGNFEHRKNILHVTKPTEELAKQFGKTRDEAESILSKGRLKLLEHRAKRPRPHRDDKVIAGWNGLMISSLASGGAALHDPKYVNAAERAAEFVLASLWKDGRLRRYYRNGEVVGLGVLDDYAFMVTGLSDLCEATFEAKWLIEARELTNGMMELFDDDAGGFYLKGKDSERLIVRTQPAYDGAVPSGNSVAALNLLRLGRITTERRFTERGERLLETFSEQLSRSPLSLSAMLSAVDFWIGPTREIVVAGDRHGAETNEMLKLIRGKFLPNAVVLFHPEGRTDSAIYEVVPFIKNQAALGGRATACVCENYVCKQPVNEMDALEALLDRATGNEADS